MEHEHIRIAHTYIHNVIISKAWGTFFAFFGDGLGLLAAAVALLQCQTASALIGGGVTLGPGGFVVAASCKEIKRQSVRQTQKDRHGRAHYK